MNEEEMREALAEALIVTPLPSNMRYGLPQQDILCIADHLLPTVRRIAAEELHEFYLDAAHRATALGRRGPNAVADWLLDIGRERLNALDPPKPA